jgi:hypothetical protein
MALDPGAARRDLDDEVRLHLGLCREQQMAAGPDPEAAPCVALRRFGNTSRH